MLHLIEQEMLVSRKMHDKQLKGLEGRKRSVFVYLTKGRKKRKRKGREKEQEGREKKRRKRRENCNLNSL